MVAYRPILQNTTSVNLDHGTQLNRHTILEISALTTTSLLPFNSLTSIRLKVEDKDYTMEMPQRDRRLPAVAFPFLNRLPEELRVHIWTFALPGPRIIYA